MSYGKDYRRNWGYLQNRLEGDLEGRMPAAQVLRLVDDGNPQLVSQSLYEQIRRTAGCVVDWTEYSPSTFYELGVRLAVSEWGAIQVVDQRYLPGGKKAGKWESMSRQIERLRVLFRPLRYELDRDADSFKIAAERLFERNPGLDRRKDPPPDYDRVHRVVSNTLKDVEEVHVSVFDMLRKAADALHHPDQGQMGAPQILFRNERLIKRASERTAMEERIAAWLYLHHRMAAGERDPGDPLREMHDKLGEEAAGALDDAGDVFGEEIWQRLESESEI